jgi:hypothetical protein
VTREQLIPLIDQYRAGLDAELMLLHRLQALAIEQRRVSQTGSIAGIHTTVDDRDRVLATLVKVEHELRGVRQQLIAGREWLADLPAFQEIVERHKEAADLVADIIGVDRDSIEALREAEQARRIAAQSLEQGESTLAAYRRIVSPELTPATLVNRRG